MADTTFIITPSGDDYSMVSDGFFNSLESNQYSQSINPDIALDWLLNVKKFCVTEESGGGCKRGIYKTTYGIKDYASYATPVTDLGSNYKEPQIGGSDSSTSTGAAGEVMQTSPRNPHRYTLQEDDDNYGNPPTELTGEYLGAFFHHKGSWYASFDDIDGVGSGPVDSKEITENTKKIERGGEEDRGAKAIYVLEKFFAKGAVADVEDCFCVQNMIITFTSDGEGVANGLETRLIDEKDREACGGCESGSEYMNCIPDDGIDNNFMYEAGRAYIEGDWTSSFNIDLWANIDAGDQCYTEDGADAEGFCLPKVPYTVVATVEYRGDTKSRSYTTYMIPTGTNCAGLYVGVLTVYSDPLPDGTYFELM